jgi:predicted nucleic acid-binding protein
VSDIDAVLDTDVLIEIFRGDDRARAWLARIASHVLGIPIFVYMGILLGVRNKREQRALAPHSIRAPFPPTSALAPPLAADAGFVCEAAPAHQHPF